MPVLPDRTELEAMADELAGHSAVNG